MAAHATKLYQVDVLVVDESVSVRRDAFKQGLDEVFIRLSGDSIIMDKLKRPSAATYVKQYSYEPVEKPITNQQGKLLTHRITMQYNGSLVGKYLQQNGFPVWGEHRAEVVVWLAIRDGRNEYVLKQSDQSLLKVTVDEALVRRGVPVRWPLYDNKDKKLLNVADIRGGFKDPITLASKRYSRGPALAGSLIWGGKQWQSSWSLLMPNNDSQWENRHWSLVGADYNLLINRAIDKAGDALGVVFAIHGSASNKQLKTIQVNIQAVDSIQKYRHIEQYLTGLYAVESVKPSQIDEQSVVFDVALRSKESDFLNLIKNDAELLKVEHQAIVTPKIEPQKVATEKWPANEPSVDLQDSTSTVEALNTELAKKQPEPITVYYYRLLK